LPAATRFIVRIAARTYKEVSAAPLVNCVIPADPVTALIVISGRLSQWPAIALGGLRFTGAEGLNESIALRALPRFRALHPCIACPLDRRGPEGGSVEVVTSGTYPPRRTR
jgi:hypothetical protein